MIENLTEIVFILDRSGSMYGIAKDTIGGYNSFIESQKQEKGEAIVTTILFDDKYEVLYNGVDIKKIAKLTDKEYSPRGCTALYDAIGKTINNVSYRINKSDEKYKPSKVIFVITTDGEENASEEYNKKIIKKMINDKTEEDKWQFMFLGANIDSSCEAESIGIDSKFASNYSPDCEGVEILYSVMNDAIATYREAGILEESWNDRLEE